MSDFAEFNRTAWAAQSIALFIPFTAILHNTVFFRGTCILNLLGGPDYNASSPLRLFQKDPSSWIAVGLALCVYFAGLLIPHPFVRDMVPLFLISTIPISLWIWDIPLARQPICRNFHDLRLKLPVIGALRSRHIYLLCMALFAGLVVRHFLA